MDADSSFAAAQASDAQSLAPYEYAQAEAYLWKAREEQSYSDFELSNAYALKSLESSRKAVERSRERKSNPAQAPSLMPRNAPPPSIGPIVAPPPAESLYPGDPGAPPPPPPPSGIVPR